MISIISTIHLRDSFLSLFSSTYKTLHELTIVQQRDSYLTFTILPFYISSERSGRDKRIERAVGVCKRVVSAFSWKKKKDLAADQGELTLPQHKMVAYKMGVTSKDGRESAGTREGHHTGLVNGQKRPGIWLPRCKISTSLSQSDSQGNESTCILHRCPLWGRICQCILPSNPMRC